MLADGLTETAILLRISQERECALRAGSIYLQSDCNTVLPYLANAEYCNKKNTLIKYQFVGKI